MDNKTREALLKSIFVKWENILSCKGDDLGSGNCPLCELFDAPFCDGCPVFSVTGYPDCNDTPYEEWNIKAPYRIKYYKWLGNNPDSAIIDIGVKEQEFLISLLSKGDQENLETLHKNFMISQKK